MHFLILFFLIKCHTSSTTDFSRLLAIVNQLNVSLQSKQIISSPYSRSPFFNPLFSSSSKMLTLANTHFSKIGSSVIQGQSFSLRVTNCKFSNSLTPVHLTGDTDPEIRKVIEKQMKQQEKPIVTNKTESLSRTIENGNVNFDQTMFEFCRSQANGGCLQLINCIATITSCYFFQNSAKSGGSVYISGGDRSRIIDCNFVKCFARTKGGALYATGSFFTLQHSNFAKNRAGVEGGAIFISNSNIECISNKIYTNQASKRVGGMAIIECEGKIVQNSFHQNVAIEENNGSSLLIEQNSEILCIETNYFYDKEDFPVYLSISHEIYFTNNYFLSSSTNSISFDIQSSQSDISENFKITNCGYLGKGIKPFQNLPFELMREEFIYDENEPAIEWKSLYLVSAIFAIILLFIVIFMPLLTQPTIADSGWSKQTLQNNSDVI